MMKRWKLPPNSAREESSDAGMRRLLLWDEDYALNLAVAAIKGEKIATTVEGTLVRRNGKVGHAVRMDTGGPRPQPANVHAELDVSRATS